MTENSGEFFGNSRYALWFHNVSESGFSEFEDLRDIFMAQNILPQILEILEILEILIQTNWNLST